MASKAKKTKAPARKATGKGATPGGQAIDTMSYAETQAALTEARNRVSQLTAHAEQLERDYQAGTHAPEVLKDKRNVFVSDDGVKVAWLSGSRLVNATEDPRDFNGRRNQVVVNGKTYGHVGETPGGLWVYRQI